MPSGIPRTYRKVSLTGYARAPFRYPEIYQGRNGNPVGNVHYPNYGSFWKHAPVPGTHLSQFSASQAKS